MRRVLLPLIGISILVAAWAVAVWFHRTSLLPRPGKVLLGIVELARRGLLIRHLVASLFRVTWGYLAAVLLGVPIGLSLGWWRRAGHAVRHRGALRPCAGAQRGEPRRARGRAGLLGGSVRLRQVDVAQHRGRVLAPDRRRNTDRRRAGPRAGSTANLRLPRAGRVSLAHGRGEHRLRPSRSARRRARIAIPS